MQRLANSPFTGAGSVSAFVDVLSSPEGRSSKTYKVDSIVAAGLEFPSFLEPGIDSLVDFFYQHRHDENISDWHPENQLHWVHIMGESLSFANSGDSLEDFVLEREEIESTRFDKKAMSRLNCVVTKTGDLLKIFDKSDVLLERPLKLYKYIDEHQDKLEYSNFLVARTKQCLEVFVKDYKSDVSMEKYRKNIILDPLVGERALGIAALSALRNIRGRENSTEKLIKTAMVLTAGKPFTADKFDFKAKELDDTPDGLVMHYGSGSVRAKSRLAYNNCYCVDPLYDGPNGYMGTHQDLHSELLKGERAIKMPTLVTSDACAYASSTIELNVRRTKTRRNREIRSMDPAGTNQIAMDIYSFWRERGYKGNFILKMGVDTKMPKGYEDVKGKLLVNQRPTNAEFIVHVGEGDRTIMEIMRSLNGHMLLSNYQRLMHVVDGTFPDKKLTYSPMLDSVIKRVRRSSYFVKPDKYGFVNKVGEQDVKEAIRKFDLDGVSHAGSVDIEHTLKLFEAADTIHNSGPVRELDEEALAKRMAAKSVIRKIRRENK